MPHPTNSWQYVGGFFPFYKYQTLINSLLTVSESCECQIILTLKVPENLQLYGLYVYYLVHICDFGMLRVKGPLNILIEKPITMKGQEVHLCYWQCGILGMFTLSSRQCHCVHKRNTIWLSSLCIVHEFVPKVISGERADVPKVKLGKQRVKLTL